METIIFATGISKLDANIMASLTEKAGPDAYKEVGYATHLDTLYDQCKQKRPSIVVIREGLQGKTDFLDTLRKIKTEIPDIRIVVITKDRPVGDSLLVSLTIYNIYDFISAASVKGSQIADLIMNPRTYADIEQYVPVINHDNSAKYSFETKTIVDNGVRGGDSLGDIAIAENDPGLTEDISGDRAFSAGKDLGAIVFEGVDESDNGVFKKPIRRTSTVPSGSKLGYKPFFNNTVNSLRRKRKDEEEKELTVNLSEKEQGHQAYVLSKPEQEHPAERFVEPEFPPLPEIEPEVNPAITPTTPVKEEEFTIEMEDLPVEEPKAPEVKPEPIPEKKSEPKPEPKKEAHAKPVVEKDIPMISEVFEPEEVKERLSDRKEEAKENVEDVMAKVRETMTILENFMKENGIKKPIPMVRDEEPVKVEKPLPVIGKKAEGPLPVIEEKVIPVVEDPLPAAEETLPILEEPVLEDPAVEDPGFVVSKPAAPERPRKEKKLRHAKIPAKDHSGTRYITFLKPFGNENTVALNLAVELARKMPGQVAFVLAKDPTDKSVYDGMFVSEAGKLKLANNSEEPVQLAIIVSTNDALEYTLNDIEGFKVVVTETMDPGVLKFVKEVVVDVPQDRFLLDVIKEAIIEDVKEKDFHIVIPQFNKETGLREKTIRRFLGVPGEKVICLNDEEHLNGASFHTKAPYFLSNDEKAKEYLAPLMEKLGF